MARFFVGQRVKVARFNSYKSNLPAMSGQLKVGDEGTVVGTDSRPSAGFVHQAIPYLSVHMDCLGRHGMGPAECFEPILPEGHKPSEFTTLRDLMDSLEGVRA